MPELPEVEVIRLFLQDHLINCRIDRIQILSPKSFQGEPSSLIGESITNITRLGKQLSLHLSNGLLLHFHLKMTGQIIYQAQRRTILGHPTPSLNQKPLPNSSTRVIFYLSDNSILYFNDQRKFGWIKVMTQSELTQFQSRLGLDILDPGFTPAYLYHQLHTTTRPVKVALLDQQKFAGIGNIYANDALFLSRIHPLLPANRLTRAQARSLHRHLVYIIQESILHGGSTARDNTYIRPDSTPGTHQYHFRVYQKEGQPCPVCASPIVRIKQSGRSTFYCQVCQK